jgi:hypothetical protein
MTDWSRRSIDEPARTNGEWRNSATSEDHLSAYRREACACSGWRFA